MTRRGFVRRVIFPSLWLVIGLAVAASLVKLAFLGGSTAAGGDRLTPTGKGQSQTVPVEPATVENNLTVEGTIELDPAQSALATADGVVVYSYVKEGDRVEAGDRLFQIRSETTPPPSADPEAPPPAPRRSYTNVLAPVGGKVGGFAFEVGDDVTRKTAMASVQPRTFKAVGAITPLDRYRLLDRPDRATVTIKGGPKPFTCKGLAIGDAAAAAAPAQNPEMMGPDGGGGTEAASSITCRVPGKVTVFDGLSMSMEIKAGSAKDVLVVPVTAVRGLMGTGSVWVLGPDGLETERQVRLGVTDGKVVEVRSGLKSGDTVLRYVPGSTAEVPEDGFQGEMVYG